MNYGAGSISWRTVAATNIISVPGTFLRTGTIENRRHQYHVVRHFDAFAEHRWRTVEYAFISLATVS